MAVNLVVSYISIHIFVFINSLIYMSYDVEMIDKKEYVVAQVTGERRKGFEITDASEAWTTIANYCNSNSVSKLLVVSKLTGEISITKSYNIATSLEKFGLSKDLKIAFIDTDIDAVKTNSFSASHARNNGYYILVFNFEEEGIKWLLK